MTNTIFNEKDMIELQELLRANNKTITTAESCTGGLVAHRITQISGSSDILNGAIVSYSNGIKHQELNVQNSTLEKYGAVSVQTVEEMLNGAIKKFDANYAIAISGISGPTGGTKDKPVGTVVIGISDDQQNNEINVFSLKGNRNQVQIQACEYSLKEILKFVRKKLDK